MKLIPDMTRESDLVQITMRIVVEALVLDGLVSADRADAWLSCHAVTLVDSSWSRCLHLKLRSWLGIEEGKFRPLVVKLYDVPPVTPVMPDGTET
jgi:hypothetical protein